MSQQIRYAANGDRTYFLDGKEVDEKTFWTFDHMCSPGKLRDMFSEGRAPHGVSDCTFMKGTANGSQFEKQAHIGDAYKRTTESLGGSTKGKKYVSGLAAFPGDPEAWVDSRGDVQRILEKRGWGSEGTINVKPRESINPPKSGPNVAEELVTKYATEIAMRDPHPERVDMTDLKDQVRDHIKPPKHLRKKK